jgi:hypothetical protein
MERKLTKLYSWTVKAKNQRRGCSSPQLAEIRLATVLAAPVQVDMLMDNWR